MNPEVLAAFRDYAEQGHSFTAADVRELLGELDSLAAAARYVTETYYDAGGDMTGPLGEALDSLDLTLAAFGKTHSITRGISEP